MRILMTLSLLVLSLWMQKAHRTPVVQKPMAHKQVVRPDGLAGDCPDLIPVHDLTVKTHVGGRITGHFYLGGTFNPAAAHPWPHGKPRIFLQPYHARPFIPGKKPLWVYAGDADDPLAGSLGGAEGAQTTFDVPLPKGIDQDKFWIAVELRGTSLENHDEVSFVAKDFPTPAADLKRARQEMTKVKTGKGKVHIVANQIIPITFMYEIRDEPLFMAYNDEVFTNLKGYSMKTASIYKLPDPHGTADLGQNWISFTAAEKAFVDPNESVKPRRHAMSFDSMDEKRFMVVVEHGTDANGQFSDEWSGIIRPPG
jgi:hypothetical protein